MNRPGARPGIACAGGDDAANTPRGQSGASTICKESSNTHDYSDSRVARRSQLNHISVLLAY